MYRWWSNGSANQLLAQILALTTIGASGPMETPIVVDTMMMSYDVIGGGPMHVYQ